MKDFIIIALLAISSALWIWAMVDIAKSRFKTQRQNTLWYLLIWLLPIMGTLAYFQRKKYITKVPKEFEPQFDRV